MKKILIFIIPILIYSCSSSHEIHINSDDSAKISFSINNKKSLVETLKEWGAVQNSNSEIVDANQVKKDLENDSNLSNVDFKSTGENSYSGSFLVKNIDQLFDDKSKELPENLKVFSLSKSNGVKTLTIKMSLENYEFLKESIPMLQNESIEMLGPTANQDVTKEEYLDMMSFSLGDEGPKDLVSSFINMNITVDGEIINIIGGNLANNKATFKVPLLDLILLQKTLTYSISYK